MSNYYYEVVLFDDPDLGAWGLPVATRNFNDLLSAENWIKDILEIESDVYCASIWIEREDCSEIYGTYYWNGQEIVQHVSAAPVSKKEALKLKKSGNAC